MPFPRDRPFLHRLAYGLFLGANNASSCDRSGLGSLDFQQGCRLVEEFRKVAVLTIDAAEVDRQRHDCALIAPGRVDDDFAPRGLSADILRCHAVDPDFSWLFHIPAVVTYELQHGKLEAAGLAGVVREFSSRRPKS